MKHRADIDGLRAVAVTAVIITHLFHKVLPGGFLGVDIFFVISGFLITSLILKEILSEELALQPKPQRRFSFSQFYLRRARRILPALSVVLIFSLIGASMLMQGQLWSEFLASFFAAIFSVSNMYFHSLAGYWDSASVTKVLLHTWSLAVEEQFYFIFPIFLVYILIKKHQSLHNSLRWMLVCAFASWALCMMLNDTFDNAVFFLLPFRLWELMTGGVLAVICLRRPFQLSKISSHILGCCAIAALLFCFYAAPSGIGIWTTIAVVSSAILIAVPQSCIAHILSRKPFVFIGKISYSLYLWHWSLWSLCYMLPSVIPFAELIVIFLTFILAYLTWRYIEQPFRQLASWKSFGYAFAKLIIVALLIALSARLIINIPLLPLAQIGPDPQDYLMHGNEPEHVKVHILGKGFTLEQPHNIQFLLIGDSHAAAIAPAFESIAKSLSSFGAVISAPSTFVLASDKIHMPDTYEESQKIFNFVKNQHEVSVIVIVQAWERYKSLSLSDATVHNIRELLALGKKVILIEQAPELPKSGKILANFRTTSKAMENSNIPDRILEKIDDKNLRLIKIQDYLKSGNEYKIIHEGKLLYTDEHHLSIYGAELLIPVIEPLLKEVLFEAVVQ